MSHATFSSALVEHHRRTKSAEADSSAPRVSVLMPVHNGEKYLEEAVESILAQTFGDFEFLIINDGSTDRTREILDRFAAQDARIRVVHRENRGITPTLNELLRLARADVVARMDADDIAAPERFAKQVRFLDENPDCLMVGSSVILIDPDGCDLSTRIVPLTHEEIHRGYLNGESRLLLHPAIMFRRDPVLKLGGYNERFAVTQDIDLYLRLAEVGRLANLPEPLLRWREHLGKIGARKAQLQGETFRQIVMEAHARRGSTPPALAPAAQFKPISLAEKHRVWGWWALGSGRVATARKHALASLRLRPFSGASWKLLACAICGR